MRKILFLTYAVCAGVSGGAYAGFECRIHKLSVETNDAVEQVGYSSIVSFGSQAAQDLLATLKRDNIRYIRINRNVTGTAYPKRQFLVAPREDGVTIKTESIRKAKSLHSLPCDGPNEIKELPKAAIQLLQGPPVDTVEIRSGEYSKELCLSYNATIRGKRLRALCMDSHEAMLRDFLRTNQELVKLGKTPEEISAQGMEDNRRIRRKRFQKLFEQGLIAIDYPEIP